MVEEKLRYRLVHCLVLVSDPPPHPEAVSHPLPASAFSACSNSMVTAIGLAKVCPGQGGEEESVYLSENSDGAVSYSALGCHCPHPSLALFW